MNNKITKHQLVKNYKKRISSIAVRCDIEKSLGLNIKAYQYILNSTEQHLNLVPQIFNTKDFKFGGFIEGTNNKGTVAFFTAFGFGKKCSLLIHINRLPRNSYTFNDDLREEIENEYLKENKRRFSFARNYKEDIDHEFGHVIEHYIKIYLEKDLEEDKIIAPLWEKVRFEISDSGQEEMSIYSKTNFQEFIAECWCEGLNNSNCCKIVKEVFNQILSYFK